MELVYRPVVGLALGLMKAMKYKVTATGYKHVPETGPAVIATNHVGYLDFIFVGAAVRPRGRLVRFLAKREVFEHPVAGPLMRGMKHISVDRFGQASTAVAAAVAALERGEVVGMFPESTISRSFVPREGKSGAARMAMLAGAPSCPVRYGEAKGSSPKTGRRTSSGTSPSRSTSGLLSSTTAMKIRSTSPND